MTRMQPPRVIGISEDYTVLDGTRVTTLPDGVLGSWRELVNRVATRFAGEGVLMLDGPATKLMGLPLDRPASGELLGIDPELANDGWMCRGWSAWSTLRRIGWPIVHVCIIPWLELGKNPLLTGPERDDIHVLLTLGWRASVIHALTGTAYRATPGVTGCATIRAAYPGRRPQPRWMSPLPPDVVNVREMDIGWHRDLDNEISADGTQQWVHTYDQNKMRLAAAGVAHLAWGELQHTGATLFDRNVPGYWLIEWDPNGLMTPKWLPDLVGARQAGQIWVPTPRMALLEEEKLAPPVLDSWTERERPVGALPWSVPLLRGWTEHMRDIMLTNYPDTVRAWNLDQADDDAISATLKRIPNEAVGMIAKSGGLIYRPDWADSIIALSVGNLLRKLLKYGRQSHMWPVRIETDSVSYVSTQPDPMQAKPAAMAARTVDDPMYGRKLGEWKHTRTETLTDYITRTARATEPWRVLDHDEEEAI